MKFNPELEQLRGDLSTFESAQKLSHILCYNFLDNVVYNFCLWPGMQYQMTKNKYL